MPYQHSAESITSSVWLCSARCFATTFEPIATSTYWLNFRRSRSRPRLVTIERRKIPRDGGIIIAVDRSRQHIEVIIREDPFFVRGLADFRIIEFSASQRADDIQERIGA